MADDNLERITILLQAKDRDFARAMDRNNKVIARMSRNAQRDTTAMSRSVEGNLSRMSTSAMAFGRSFAVAINGGLAAGAVGLMATRLRQVVSGIAQIEDQARTAGVGVEAFQEWAFVAQQNRISIDAMVDGLKELSLRADEFAVTGAGPAAESFARLGYSAADVARDLQDPSEMLLEIADRMGDLETSAQVRIADELFGGSAGERFVQLVGHGEAGLRAMRDRAHEVGAVMSAELIDRAQEIDQRFSEITTRLAELGRRAVVGWGIIISTAMDAVTTSDAEQALADAHAEIVAIQGETRDLQSVMGYLADEAERLGDASFAHAFHELERAINLTVDAFEAGQISADDFKGYVDRLSGSADTALGAVQGIDGVTLDAAGEVVDGLRARLGQLAAEAAAAAEQVRAATMDYGTPFVNPNVPLMPPTGQAPTRSIRPRAAPTGDGLGYTPPSGGGVGGGSGGGSADGYAAAVADIQARTQALELEAAALVAAAAGGRDYGDAAEYARTRAALMNDALSEGRTITPELQAEIDALAEAYVTAGQSAEDAAERMDRVRENAERGTAAMTDLFMGIVQGGDAARQAIAQLLMELARVQMSRALSGLAGTGGGGLLGVIGGLLSGKRASGGPVAAGQAYQVNENTPNSEIFVPSRSGGVLNVAQAKDALRGQGGGSQSVHVTFGVDADASGNLTPFVVSVVRSGLSEFNKVLPGRVKEINENPRFR